MYDSYKTTYHVDLWDSEKQQYLTLGEHSEYDDAEDTAEALHDKWPEVTFRVRRHVEETYNRVLRKWNAAEETIA